LGRRKVIETRVRADKVEKENKHGNEIVRRSVRTKALFGLVPGLELLVESLNKVVGYIVFEGLDANVFKAKRLSRLLVGGIAVGNENGRLAGQRRCLVEQGKGLRRVSVRRQVEAENKAGFSVNNEPKIVLLPSNLNHSLVGMPLVRVKVESRKQFQRKIVEERSEASTPV